MKIKILTITLTIFYQFVVSQNDITPSQLSPILNEKIISSETTSYFGNSIDLSEDGTVLAVGEYGYSTANRVSSGRVRVYTNETGSWLQKGQDLVGIEDSFNTFGKKVELSSDGNTLAVYDSQISIQLNAGETLEDKFGNLAPEFFPYIQVYQFSNSVWTKIGDDFLFDEIEDYSDMSLSGDGLSLAIATKQNTKVYEFITNNWLQAGQEILSRDQTYDDKIDLSEDGLTLVIGDSFYSDPNSVDQFSYEGQVKVYKKNSNVWVQTGNTINGVNYLEYFGSIVSISSDGETIAIANSQFDSQDTVSIYELSGNNWTQKGTNILQSNTGAIISLQLSDDGNSIVIGEEYNARVLKYNTDWEQVNLTIESDNISDELGYAVSISGDGNLYAVGAPSIATSGKNGYITVYKNNKNSITRFGDEIYGEALYDYLGNSVSVSENGKIIAIGASGSYQSSSVARVMVYEKTIDGLVQIGEDLLKPTNNNRSFGAVVKISADGSLLAVSDPFLYNSAYGAVYVYQRNGDSWVPFGNPITGKYGSRTGSSISFSKDGSILAVGSYGNPGGVNNDGHRGYTTVYRFNNSNNTWEILGEEILGEATGDYFGYAVDLSGNGETLAVGAIGNDGETGNGSHGHVRVFSFQNNSWVQKGSDIDGDSSFNINFGGIVKLSKDGKTLFASDRYSQSSAGSVNIYNWDETNNEWVLDIQLKKYTSTGPNNTLRYEFGSDLSVSDDGDILIIGERKWQNRNSTSDGLGRVYIYTNSDNGWVENELFLSGRSRRQYFGAAVSISGNGNTLTVGGYGLNDNGTASGMAAVYELNLCSTLENFQIIDNSTEPFTSIPDENFEQYLIDENIDTDATINGKVFTRDIQNVTTLLINDKNIANLTGIEDFDNLVELNAANNQIRNIDITNNLQLEKLFIANNQITTLDLSNNLNLTNIDVGQNQITQIKVHHLTELESLSVYKNQLTEINLFSNKKLVAFIANENQLKYVDIRENINLFWLDLDDNSLEDLMLKNGSNTNITQFSITGNPNLTCIEVDDVNFSTSNWTEKDNTANYSTGCAPANDDCLQAISLVFGQPTPGDINDGSFTNSTDCVSGQIIADVWFQITVPNTGEFSIEGTGYGGLLKFAIYDSCSSSSAIACGIDISLTNLTPGDIYYLKVWMEDETSNKNTTSDQGTFTLIANESSVLSIDNFNAKQSEILLYPNPASTSISIELSNNKSLEKIEVFSILGDKVHTQISEGSSKIVFDVSNFASGIYLVKAKTENQVLSKRLIIDK